MSKRIAIHDLSLRCGDCNHHKGSAHPSFGSVCHALGTHPAQPAPECFTPNFRALRTLGNDTWGLLATILSTLSPQQTRVLLSVMQTAGRLEKYGFSFLDTGYFLAGTEDVLTNYARGFVLGAGSGGTLILAGDTWLRNPSTSVLAYLDARSILSKDDWQRTRESLLRRGRISAHSKPVPPVMADYEPPSLDTSDLDLEALARKGKKRKSEPNVDRKSKYLEVELENN